MRNESEQMELKCIYDLKNLKVIGFIFSYLLIL